MKPLERDAVQQRLNDVEGWSLGEGEIRKSFRFESFAGAMDFVNRVAREAEAADHHPDMDIRYDRVDVALSTHAAGGLTHRDFDLARSIDELI